MRKLLFLAASALVGCSSTSTFELQPTEPLAIRETTSDLSGQLADARLLVLSPLSLEQTSGRLTREVANESTTASPDGNLGHTTDYNVAASAIEAHLLNSEYTVVSQAALAQYAKDGGLEGELEAIRAQGNLTLLEAALILAPAASADASLLIRSVQVYYDPTPLGWLIHPANNVPLYVLEANAVLDAVLVSTETKEVLWSGRTRVRASDLLEEPGSVTAASNGFVDNTFMHYTHLRWPLVGVESLTASSVKRVDHPEVINDLLELGTRLLVESLDRAAGRSSFGVTVEPAEEAPVESDEGMESSDGEMSDAPVEDSSEAPADSSAADAGETPAEAGETPADAGETPADAGETPAEAGETPADAGETPADAGETPADAGETPADAGETPADSGN